MELYYPLVCTQLTLLLIAFYYMYKEYKVPKDNLQLQSYYNIRAMVYCFLSILVYLIYTFLLK